MANNCYFEMKIVGSGNDVFKFFNNIKNKKITCRIYSIDVYEENLLDGYIKTYGDCAWSVYSAMIDYPEFMSAIQNLTVEIYGSEPGGGFQEHYIIENGKFIKDEEASYMELCEDDEFELEELAKDLKCQVSQLKKQMDEQGCIKIDGLDNFGEFEI